MSRRKKKKPTGGSTRRPAEVDDGLGTLGDLLGRRANAAAPVPSTAAPTAPPEPAPEPPAPARRQVTEADLMAEAFAAAADAPLWEAKFQGRGYEARDVEVIEAPAQDDEAPGRRDRPAAPLVDAMTPEERMFLDAMGGDVQPLDDRDRYAELSDHSFVGAKWRDEVELTRLTAEELMEPSLTADQRDTLKRSRRQRMPTLNIRHLRKAEAITNVEAFVRTARVDGHRFVRIIHGKGRQSEGDPVLKPAVIAWCDGPAGGLVVRRWAPETDRSGNFGCIVLELRLGGR